jgi:NO-binding membrane sensor protein with MHYT domain
MISSGESSPLLWLVAALVSALAAYLFIGWVRRGRHAETNLQALGPVLLAGFAMGLGIVASVLLSLAAEALPFPLGYRWIWVPGLVAAAMVGAMPLAYWLVRQQRLWAAIGVGLLLAALAGTVQAGWVLAAGLRPGVRWNPMMLGVAGLVMAVGFSAALWLAFSDASSDGARRTLWRASAAALMALSLVTGQELVLSSVNLLAQVGSVYQREAASPWMVLAAGAVVPVLMGMLTLDLVLRNHADRRRSGSGSSTLELPKRRKRRRKYRTL